MSAAPKKQRISVAEYLALEESAADKSEFFNGEMFPLYGPHAMAGGSPAHNILKDNLVLELGKRLAGGPCRTLSSDQRVHVELTGLYTYPDVVIVCGKMEFDKVDPHSLTNPTAVFEVLSPSTQDHDLGTKFRHFRTIASMREIAFVSQDRMLVERFVRQSDDRWILSTFDHSTESFTMATLPVSIPMTDLYRDVELGTSQ